jgi:hypothetical protein
MSLASIASGLISPLTDLYANRQELKRQKAEAQATVDEIHAKAIAEDSTVSGKIALVNTRNQNATWKDEFALITIALPYWVAMFTATTGYGDAEAITAMFAAMKDIPLYWQETFQYGILAALGITQLKKAITR